MTAAHVAAIVLAAGNSARMGACNKLLMAWNGEPLVRRTVQAALDSGIDDVIVVVAADQVAVSDALRDLPVRIVENVDHAEGIASSIRVGVDTVTASCAGALILLADMPLVAEQHLATLLNVFAAGKDTSAVIVPCYRGQRGNPLLWGRDYFNELRQLRGDAGAHGLLQRHAERSTRIEMTDNAVLVDVDTPHDWARLHTALAS